MRVEYESPEIAKAAAEGKYLFTATKIEHTGSFDQPRTLEITYPTINAPVTGAVVKKTVDSTALAKGQGLFTLALLDAPLTEEKMQFIVQHGKYHGDNAASAFVQLPNTDLVLVMGNTIAGKALGRLELTPGKGDLIPFKELQAETGLRQISLEHRPAVENFMKRFLAGHLNFIDPNKLTVEIRPRSATNMQGKPLKATFADSPNTLCHFDGTITLTCAFCEAIPATPSK
jgi:hypothetical protein